ncbi:2'-5' RNA ligase family protein [Phyllobacterium sp. 628]|uniref:2'-5' RNA ligase family protein n=1 Tax=Phyllobacterium sp. 628 TaxID=2718938 RepID=UPI0016622480|nr:2'-5' RNA ligase family protein [Phyllobacterium sp. 628]QND52138.1 2'-5' RNA ligase family protein [Phyllobacterium sp. 628]
MQHEFDLNDGWANRPWQPENADRMFFGLMTGSSISDRVSTRRTQLVSALNLDARGYISEDRFHVSLLWVSDRERLRSQEVLAARLAGNAVAMTPFELTFDRARSFPGGKRNHCPFVLLGEGDGVRQLYQRLGSAMIANGLRTRMGDYCPHLTLLYDQRFVTQQEIEPIRFKVNEFFLIHSKRGLSEYEILDRWTLH